MLRNSINLIYGLKIFPKPFTPRQESRTDDIESSSTGILSVIKLFILALESLLPLEADGIVGNILWDDILRLIFGEW